MQHFKLVKVQQRQYRKYIGPSLVDKPSSNDDGIDLDDTIAEDDANTVPKSEWKSEKM